jgi:hypothetical protein
VFSRRRSSFGFACLLSSALLAVSGCGGDGDSTGSQRGGAARGGGFSGNASLPGPGLGNSGAPPVGDLGRPGMLPPVMQPPPGMSGGSGCLDAVVLFVIDGSGSMCDTFGTGTRWTSLRSALLAPGTGVITRLEGEAQFGLMIYDGSVDFQALSMATMGSPSPACAGTGNARECPRLTQVPPKFGNAAAIGQMFPNKEPGGSTPTHKAMDLAVQQMMMSAAGKDPMSSPHFIVLATDGQPNDICTGGLGGDGSAEKAAVIAAVDRAVGAGIRTFVISLAGMDQGLEAHLAEVAKHGDPLNPAARTFSPMTPEDLQMALRTVLSSALGCVI